MLEYEQGGELGSKDAYLIVDGLSGKSGRGQGKDGRELHIE